MFLFEYKNHYSQPHSHKRGALSDAPALVTVLFYNLRVFYTQLLAVFAALLGRTVLLLVPVLRIFGTVLRAVLLLILLILIV